MIFFQQCPECPRANYSGARDIRALQVLAIGIIRTKYPFEEGLQSFKAAVDLFQYLVKLL